MSFLKRLTYALTQWVKTYPALVTGALNIAIAFAARYGFHVSVDQLLTVVTAVTAFVSYFTHSQVIPLTKLGRS